MPFVLVFIGLLMAVAGFRGRERELGSLLVGDFSGPGNFVYWIVALMAIGFIGYIPGLKNFSTLMLVLVLLVILLVNNKGSQGFFQRFNQSISASTAAPNVSTKSAIDSTAATGGSGGGGTQNASSGGGIDTGTLIQGAELAAMFL